MSKKNILKRLAIGIVVYSIVVNFVFEPLSLLSDRIPSGSTHPIPDKYIRSWEGANNDGDLNVYLDIKNGQATFKLFSAGEGTTTRHCSSHEIYYKFHRVPGSFLDLFVQNLYFYLVPDTLFGSQIIKFKCKDQNIEVYLNDNYGLRTLTLNVIPPKGYVVTWEFFEK